MNLISYKSDRQARWEWRVKLSWSDGSNVLIFIVTERRSDLYAPEAIEKAIESHGLDAHHLIGAQANLYNSGMRVS